MKSSNFNDIYTSVLWTLYTSPDFIEESTKSTDKERVSGYRELNGFQFKLTNINNNIITKNLNRKFNLEYAVDFFSYIMNGDKAEVVKNPSAAPYLVEFGGRNTQYGSRIHDQLYTLVDELVKDKGSRRGSIVILEKGDQQVLSGKREGDTTIEYPCTNSLTFSIREDKLHLVSNMRSQSAVLVMPYDIYNWTGLMQVVCNLLKPTYPELVCGTLTHQVASLHYFNSETPLVKAILTENGLLV